MLDKIKDFRFFTAAISGAAVGLGGHMAGVNTTSIPGLEQTPGMFFGALPYVALPFISLSIFRAFSEKSLMEEAGTLVRFAGTMATGVMIGLGMTYGMSDILAGITPPDPSEIRDASGGGGPGAFSPSQYILHGIGLFAAFSVAYKSAKNKLSDGFNKAAEKKDGVVATLSNVFNKASGVLINKYTAPAIVKAGDITKKAANIMDKGFFGYMNYLGIPAIFMMMNNVTNKGGFEQLANYGGYYATVTAGMAACAVALTGAAYAYGCRKKEFGEIAKTVSTAFGISSSAATMPVTKESLKNMGVSAKTRESVVPLGANFNMMGTSLYLGVTAASAMVMFDLDPTPAKLASVMLLSVGTAFGAPGAPASTLIFLDPVLAKAGLSAQQAQKIYEMVIPADRIFDMAQTSLNVWGDMTVAIGKHKRELKNKAKKLLHLKETKDEMLESNAKTDDEPKSAKPDQKPSSDPSLDPK
jgi:hypothetical protein